jgi:poly-gamma-glutamate synthesis protein (capsule biosynthesis protein)
VTQRQPGPAYQASAQRIGPRLARRMRSSHRPGCPVPLAELRLLRVKYVGFDGAPRTGELVVHQDHAEAVTGVFAELYDARWRVARMRLVDAYRGDDDRSMAANNTSAFNCRRVAGSPDWSEHASGAAIDVNPVQNPYVTDGLVAPPSGQRFAGIDRTRGVAAPRGVIRRGDVVVRAFARIGWEWGGNWSTAKDYQHFSASGR